MTLKELRKTCNLTQKEAAELTKTSVRSFIMYENDEDAADQLRLQRIKEILEEYADNDINILKDKVLLITGGTGSFGNAVLNRFLKTDIGEIRIFSRDEKKQDDMRHEYQAKYPDYFQKIKFYIGDVRSLESCRGAMHGVDYIFHAAALKQVPSCEFFPMEAVKTNVIGTDNILTAQSKRESNASYAYPRIKRHTRSTRWASPRQSRRRWRSPSRDTARAQGSAALAMATLCVQEVLSSLFGLTRSDKDCLSL